MKCITQSFFLILLSFTCLGQTEKEKAKDQSNVEKFSSRGGTLIQKEYGDVGKVKGCKVQIARIEDMITNQKINGIRFEYVYTSSYSSDTKVALIDVDEIDALIKSLKIINEKITSQTPVNYTEVSFTGRSGFEAGCFYSREKWSFYVKLEKYDSNSFVFMDKNDVVEFLALVEQAKTKL